MSGPKVVRVVTREEVLNICRGQLAQLDSAIEEWMRIGKRNDCISELEIAATQKRRDTIVNLLRTDEFVGIQKQVPQEISFLGADMEKRLDCLASQKANARSKERRQREGALTLLSALRKSGKPVPQEIEAALKKGTDAAAISAAWKLLDKGVGTELSESQTAERQRLLSTYSQGLERRSFAGWLETQPVPATEPALVMLDQKISELQIHAPVLARDFEKRIDELEFQNISRRALLIDSLNLDISLALTDVREKQKLFSDLTHLLAELRIIAPDQAPGFQAKADIVAPTDLVNLVGEARAALVEAREKQAADLRRSTLLTNLAALGYEVTEGMSTAWVNDGRLVVRNALRQDYGVEIGGNMSSPRVQMRVVNFTDAAAPADKARDRDAETLWCNEVSTLSEKLKAVGSEIYIERSTPIGATPVKRVADPAGTQHLQQHEVSTPRLRSLP